MNELTKRQTALDILGIDEGKLKQSRELANLPNIEARKGFPIRSLLNSEIQSFLSKQIELIADNLGQKNPSLEVMGAITNGLPSTLNMSYFNWTREEMAQAFQLGSLGKLGGGEIHLSARTLIQWLDQYNEQHRKPAYKKLKLLSALKQESDTNTPNSDKMTEKEKREALNEAFEDRELIKKAPKHYFKLLTSLGLCKISDKAETWELIGKANAELLIEIKELAGISREEAINRKNKIKGISQEDPSTIPEFVLNRAKQIKILAYFDGLGDNHKF